MALLLAPAMANYKDRSISISWRSGFPFFPINGISGFHSLILPWRYGKNGPYQIPSLDNLEWRYCCHWSFLLLSFFPQPDLFRRYQGFLAAHVGPQGLGDADAAIGLEVVFQEGNEHPGRGHHGVIEGVGKV